MKNWKEEKNIFLSDIVDESAEFIPLLSNEEEESMQAEDIPEILPVLPLRNTVLFPGVVIPITVGREKSLKLIKEYYQGNKTIGVVAQVNSEIEEPEPDDLNAIGTVAYIIKLLQMPDETTTAIIQGKNRFKLGKIVRTEPYIKAEVEKHKVSKPPENDKKFMALVDSIRDIAMQIIKQSPHIPQEASFALRNIESPSFLVNFVSSNLNISIDEKQELLEITDLGKQAQKALSFLSKELQIIELKNQIQSKVKTDIDKQQRDYLLHQQLKTIQDELGGSPSEQEINDLNEKAKGKKWPDEVAEVFEKEMAKLQRMNPAAAEYSVQMNYLEVLVELPWNEYSNDDFDLKKAQDILDEDHYGLKEIKERIIEHLAVLKLKGDMKSPILCLVGPPGVGKTSLGKSVARALGRKYVRMSLGGVRDEAELRGHRKTYIGAMPGRIVQNLKKAKYSNPVFVLDEVDKIMGMNVSGDPQAALLEILDPEQNSHFYDNYLEVDYDLSKVMFIATANTLSTIHPALRDRLEIIQISGYTQEEKVEIACRHLLPKQLAEHGIKKSQVGFTKSILEKIISEHTRESGVRAMEKKISKILRSKAKFIAMGEKYNKSISINDLDTFLGPPPFHKDKAIGNDLVGVATGLAWTQVGGEILFVETSLSKGKGTLTLTGNLGDVMKESATLALEYLKSKAGQLKIDSKKFENLNVHIHVPEGATPKDGPSAGITMFTSLASAFTQRKIRSQVAMTGEITLRGKVLPVGGIKEKILAARRAKITEIILSEENRKNVLEIDETYRKDLTFHYVDTMMDVIGLALAKVKSRAAKVLN